MRRLLLENVGWKLLSLAIAIVLWIIVVGRPNSFERMIPSQVRVLLDGRQNHEVPVHPPEAH